MLETISYFMLKNSLPKKSLSTTLRCIQPQIYRHSIEINKYSVVKTIFRLIITIKIFNCGTELALVERNFLDYIENISFTIKLKT